MTQILVTGAAGFIGYHACMALLQRGDRVVGIDNFEPYYDVALKHARLDRLRAHERFEFHQGSITDAVFLARFAGTPYSVTHVLHLAAQAGVRYSVENPHAYADANIYGHLCILEWCRRHGNIAHFVYASSSSVYGTGNSLPYHTGQQTNRPASLYAASKISGEAMSHSYAHLYRLPATGLRFFTAYGPFGRPDMAYTLFTDALFNEEPITLYNRGNMRRDFTYIDDIVRGILLALDQPPAGNGEAPHAVYNLARGHSIALADFVASIELAAGRKAIIEYADMQLGDVVETWGDIDDTRLHLGYDPQIDLKEGIARFVEWYRDYHRV